MPIGIEFIRGVNKFWLGRIMAVFCFVFLLDISSIKLAAVLAWAIYFVVWYIEIFFNEEKLLFIQLNLLVL